MFKLSNSKFSKDEKVAIKKFLINFDEKVPFYDQTKFSDYYFLLSTKSDYHYHYDKEVVIIGDNRFFSAADVFLNAMKSFEKVKYMGFPFSGGSGAKRRYKLKNTRVKFYLSRMISLKRSGEMFERKTTLSDIKTKVTPGYFLKTSEDSILLQALKNFHHP